MSGACSLESGESNLALRGRGDSELSGSLRTTRTAKRSSENTGLTHQSTGPSSNSTSTKWKDRTCSQADSPANPSARRENEKARKMSGGFGPITRKPFAFFDLDSSSWRMFQTSLLSTKSSVKFSATWPRAGTMRNGRVFVLPMLEHHTEGNESSSLLTPSAVSYGSNIGGGMGRVGPIRPSLETMARKNLWPTPKAQNANSPGIHGRGGLDLQTAVKMWPTPTMTDSKGRTYTYDQGDKTKPRLSLSGLVKFYPTPTTPRPHDNESTAGKYLPTQNQRDLSSVVARNGGQLNPAWVEWLMGFPIGYTALEHWATASSHSARRQSAK